MRVQTPQSFSSTINFSSALVFHHRSLNELHTAQLSHALGPRGLSAAGLLTPVLSGPQERRITWSGSWRRRAAGESRKAGGFPQALTNPSGDTTSNGQSVCEDGERTAATNTGVGCRLSIVIAAECSQTSSRKTTAGVVTDSICVRCGATARDRRLLAPSREQLCRDSRPKGS